MSEFIYPDLTEVAPHLIFPDDGSVFLPEPSPDGMFPVTPHELWAQLALGDHNPHYDHAATQDEALEYISAWHNHVLISEAARLIDEVAILGSHFTNSIARIAMHPVRDERFSLKLVFRQEEARAPRGDLVRDHSDLGVIYYGVQKVKSLLATEQPR